MEKIKGMEFLCGGLSVIMTGPKAVETELLL